MIRTATIADIPDCVELAVRFMNESAYGQHLAINKQAMAKLGLMLIRAPNGTMLVEERAGCIVGMIGVIATEHPHSGEPVMSELCWYVEPDARGTGVRLLLAAENWGRDLGVTKSIVVSPNEAVSALYERLGYQPLERQFIKDL